LSKKLAKSWQKLSKGCQKKSKSCQKVVKKVKKFAKVVKKCQKVVKNQSKSCPKSCQKSFSIFFSIICPFAPIVRRRRRRRRRRLVAPRPGGDFVAPGKKGGHIFKFKFVRENTTMVKIAFKPAVTADSKYPRVFHSPINSGQGKNLTPDT
jgi:hypothetical protein